MRTPFIQLGIALAILAGAIIACGIWYSIIARESARVAQLESQIQAKTQVATRIASARAALAEISGDEAAVQAYFVSSANVVGFIDDLEARGKALGASVSVLSVSADPSSAHTALDLVLSVKGPFNAVMRTVGAIEYAPYDIVVSDLSVGQDDKNLWHADLKLVVGSASGNLSDTAAAASTTTAQPTGSSPAPTGTSPQLAH
jgi:hypothetical protein